jgi:protein ImuB
LAAAGFRAAIAVSANYHAARMKAASMRGIAVIAEGAEAEALAKLPIVALGLDEEHAATFALWGIGTLGELAALPEAELVARIGPKARAWRALARGEAEHTFEPIEAEFALEEFCEFETPVEQIDSLLFMGARMIDCLATRAAGRALALRSLTAEMGLEGGGTHDCAIRPAVPTIDRKFLFKLLQLEIGTHPPQAAVVRLTLWAEAGAQSKVQLGLFAPQTPEPSRLDVTLARLRAMVGEERVGSPVLEDTHRAGGFRMEGFAADGESEAEMEAISRMALRRVRPARLVRVMLSPILSTKNTVNEIRAIPGPKIGTWGTRPVAFSDGENRYEIAAAYGPWRTSGCWWAMEAWDTEEWDVMAVRAEKLPSGAKAPTYLGADTARLKPCPFKTPVIPTDIEELSAGAQAHNYFASDTARDPPTGWVPRSCPDTSCLSGEISSQFAKSRPDTSCLSDEISSRSAKSCHDSQPSLSACTASSNSATIACLLVHDRARNAWRLEAFYD